MEGEGDNLFLTFKYESRVIFHHSIVCIDCMPLSSGAVELKSSQVHLMLHY